MFLGEHVAMPTGTPVAAGSFHAVRPRRRSFAQILAIFVKIIVALCAIFLLAISSWNLVEVRRQRLHVFVPGSFHWVDGRQMRLYCTGTGSPTIIIETGLRSSSLAWQLVQPKLSKLTRVCTYDRSGLGWSEPRPGPRDAVAIAQQLHALLEQAGVQRSLVLAGHSAGGFYVREFARDFPSEVTGMVLVDSSSPQQFDELPGFRADYEAGKRSARSQLWRDRLVVWSGWERLMDRCRGTPDKGLENLAPLYDAQMCRSGYVGDDFGEYVDFETAAKQAARLTSLGNKPLLLVSQDPARNSMDPKSKAWLPTWNREQDRLRSLSQQSWRVIAHGSGHNIFIDRPDLLVAEISKLITYLRGGPAPPFGTTSVE
jgi:pimeloyl-ACP methyl ester carboxylesterase